MDPLGLEACNASGLPVIKPGTPEWRAAVRDMKAPGKSKNYRVETEADARKLLRESRGEMPEYPTYTSEQYSRGFEVHPNEAHTANAPHNDLPHVKWKDWSGGKKSGGNGHVFFGD